MSHSYCRSLRGFYNVPPLSAIVHGTDPIIFEDGFCLPSCCHGRTWLLDNFQEACSETTSYQLKKCKQNLCTEDSCVQSACLPRVVQITSTNSRPCERTTCQAGAASAASEWVPQSCQSESSQQMGCVVWRCQPASYMARSCPTKTYVSKNRQTLECEFRQSQFQEPESSSYRPLVYVSPEPQLLESSSTYEPTCCVTGGLQLPSK
ncbi:keratin-associated protein 27-1 [Trichechus manatus latirostris]|uniref:Keratin-associated protein n=1 Tax=Trichechus manatus latirostris TaxID=127582 RepID=A0A2Y9EBW1_TRIMA|nr:keratin-associated protein 27-1 [Trichechus manatus latirostris]